MKRLLYILLFTTGIVVSAQENTNQNDLVNYKIINEELHRLIEVPFAVGVFGDYGNLSLGIGGRQYFSNNLRLDLGFNLQMVGSDPDFTSVSFSYDIYARGNYPLIRGSKIKTDIVHIKAYSSGYNMTTVKYIRLPMTRYKDVSVHGGYYKQYPGHKLALGINYSSRSNMVIELTNDNSSKNTRTSTYFFDVGVEALLAFAYTDYEENYYVSMGEEAQRLGFNFFTHFKTFGTSMGSFEMGWHSGLLFRLGIGVWFGK